jgi:tyrosine-protein kinase Etk/Wzc
MSPVTPPADRSLDVADLARLLVKHRFKLVVVPLLVALVTFAICWALPKYYVARVRLLPPNLFNTALRPASDESVANRIAEQFTIRNQAEVFVSVLQSDSVLDVIITRAKLLDEFGKGNAAAARNRLRTNTTIVSARDGAIDVSVTDGDAARASDLANFYVTALEARIQALGNEDASKRRDAQQVRLTALTSELAAAESEFVKVQERTGILHPGNQSYHYLYFLNDLRKNLGFKQSQMAAVRAYATEQHPAVLRLQTEINALSAQVAALERIKPDEVNARVAIGQPPAGEMEFSRAQRRIKLLEEQLAALNKQYAQSVLESSNAKYVVQVMETARPPDRPAGPRAFAIALLVGVATFVALLLGLVAQFSWSHWQACQPSGRGAA